MLTKEQYYKMRETWEISGIPMMYARRALEMYNWDVKKAVEFLKDHGPFWLSHPRMESNETIEIDKNKERIKWILQKNLTNKDVLREIEEAISLDDAEYDEILVVPFSDEIEYKKKDDECIIFYGSTTLMLNASKDAELSTGVFFNKDSFQIKNYLDKWKEKMLNGDGQIITIEEFITSQYQDNKSFFIRPNEDTKSFSGTVISYSEFKEAAAKFVNQNPHIQSESLILISEPKEIEKEWRNFIVDGRVIDASRYCINGKLNIDKNDIPLDMIKFSEDCCTQYVPHDIFVMDVALYKGKYYIIECNCFNGTGFYKHDIKKIVMGVDRFLRNK